MGNETFPLFRDLFGAVLGDPPRLVSLFVFISCTNFGGPRRWSLSLNVTLLLLVQEINLWNSSTVDRTIVGLFVLCTLFVRLAGVHHLFYIPFCVTAGVSRE